MIDRMSMIVLRQIPPWGVMRGLVPRIHAMTASASNKDVNGRDKPGHDELIALRGIYACGCGSSPPGPGRGRGRPAGGTAEPRGVVGSITDSREGRRPASRSLISSPVKV